MALGVASPWRSRFEPSARTQEGAEAEDGDRRSAGGRPGQLGVRPPREPRLPSLSWPGRRRGSKSWSVWWVANNSTSIFFARPCDLATRFRGQPRRVARPTLRAHQRFERGGEVARRKRNDERAREGDP